MFKRIQEWLAELFEEDGVVRVKPAAVLEPGVKFTPFVMYRDRADDGPEVGILRAGKVLVRRGDDFILAYPLKKSGCGCTNHG